MSTQMHPWSRAQIEAVMRLSPREYQILQGLAEGKTIGEVASEMYVSQATAKTFVARLYEKLGARNAANAIDIAYRTGVLRIDREQVA